MPEVGMGEWYHFSEIYSLLGYHWSFKSQQRTTQKFFSYQIKTMQSRQTTLRSDTKNLSEKLWLIKERYNNLPFFQYNKCETNPIKQTLMLSHTPGAIELGI